MDESRGAESVLAPAALRRVLASLEAAPSPLTAAELADRMGLHVTTVRSHLDRLEAAGLVAHEAVGERRRGRPGFRYRSTRQEPDRARGELIGVLAAALASSPGADAALTAGRQWAEGIEPSGAAAAEVLAEAFQRLGFSPRPDGNLIRLHSCPFRQAAREHPEVVCRVHLGLAQRLAEMSDGGAPTVELLPFVEPELCVVALSGDHVRNGSRVVR